MMDKLGLGKSFFEQVLMDLDEKVTPEQVRAVKAAVSELAPDAVISTSAIDALGLPPNVRANLVFKLLHRAYPEQVGAHLRAANNIAGVMKAVLAAGSQEIDWGRLPAYLEEFVERLASNPKETRTGKVSLGDLTSWSIELGAMEKHRVALEIRHSAGQGTMLVERPDPGMTQVWHVAWAGQRFPLAHLDVQSLTQLHDKLAQQSAGGTSDPMLAALRSERDRPSAGALEQLLEAITTQRDRKLKTRETQLAAVDAVLRRTLKDFVRVGEAPKGTVDQIAQAALAAVES